tara:strand:- start:50917 stop:51330 length:414 start_codon:yes stop_codon:yes gene_type:complete
MKKWKINQQIYHKLTDKHSDDLNTLSIRYDSNIAKSTVSYFRGKTTGLVYPAKSYFVGICYAKWIQQDFGDSFKDNLDDAELLFKNDPYFKRYSEAKDVYDQILSIVGLNFDESVGIIPVVRQYYLNEIQLKGFDNP